MKIPNKIRIGGQNIEVSIVDRIEDEKHEQISDACDRIINQIEGKYPELKCNTDDSPPVYTRRKEWETACGAIVMYVIHYGVPEKYHGDIVELIKDRFIPYIFYKPKGSDRYIACQNHEWLYFQTIRSAVNLFRFSTDVFRNGCTILAEEIYNKYKYAKQ